MAKYTDIRKIGSGGFGVVYACRCDADGNIYAKKKLADSADRDTIKRFAREVRILSALDHPNIVQVLAKRLHKPPFYYVMPLFKRSLHAELPSLVGDRARINIIFAQILDAVDYAHSQGIIHRDLKPENILLNNDTDLVVTDFGLGRIVDSESTRQTHTGNSMGTPWYTAPEQILDAKRADERSDIFSLGRMLYELYTGPLTSAVQDISALPPSIALAIERCTQHDPDTRFQTVSDLRTVWKNLHDQTSQRSELEELLRLRTILTADHSPSTKDVRRFCKLIVKHLDERDMLHETVMQMSSNAALQIYSADASLLKRIISEFVDFVCSQSWPFGYTDKIGSKCLDLFTYLKDPGIRADLLYCVTEVGLYHNRFYVINIMQRLFHLQKDAAEWSAIERRFLKNESLCGLVGQHLNLNKLPASMVHLFDKGGE
ncbi:MAG TPA: serine/threonine-protein kinase [Syntrophorhabdaceae bacterium]|nr:serine/threonine-protein kinase [Syntrophorhabdaceae bacterium]HQM80762.1 serine/threonine-protein kinase [Syntrophorhabdaceae bacterium]